MLATQHFRLRNDAETLRVSSIILEVLFYLTISPVSPFGGQASSEGFYLRQERFVFLISSRTKLEGMFKIELTKYI